MVIIEYRFPQQRTWKVVRGLGPLSEACADVWLRANGPLKGRYPDAEFRITNTIAQTCLVCGDDCDRHHGE